MTWFESMSNSVERVNRRSLLPLTLFLGVVLGSWLLSTPPGGRPDDGFHFSNIWCQRGMSELECKTNTDGTRLVPNSFVEGSPWWDQTRLLPTGARGEANYPDFYYSIVREFVNNDLLGSAFVIGLLNIVIGVILVIAALLCSDARDRFAVFSVMTVVPIAQGFFMVGSYQPSSWYFSALPTLYFSARWVVTSQSKKRRIGNLLLVLLCLILLLGSRPEGGPMAMLAIGIALLSTSPRWSMRVREHRQGLVNFAKPHTHEVWVLGSLVLIAILVGFSKRDLVEVQALSGASPTWLIEAPTIYFNSVASAVKDSVSPILGNYSIFAALLVAWLIFLGLREMWTGKLIAMAGLLVVMVVTPQLRPIEDLEPINSPSRYFYPFALLLVALSMSRRSDEKGGGISRAQLSTLLALAIYSHSLALHAAIDPRISTGASDWEVNLNTNLKWWWPMAPSPMSTWIIGSVSYALCFLVFFSDQWSKTSEVSKRRKRIFKLTMAFPVLLIVAVIFVYESEFYRPPLSERPAVEKSRPVEWTFEFLDPEIQYLKSSTSAHDQVDVVVENQQVNRWKNKVKTPQVSMGFIHGTEEVFSSGIRQIFLVDESGKKQEIRATSIVFDVNSNSESRFRMVDIGFRDTRQGDLLREFKIQPKSLLLEIEIGVCRPVESTVKCPLADFFGADLSRDDFELANLRGADLSRANLREAKLNSADLSGAILKDVDLRSAYLVGVDLSESWQDSVNFQGAIWTR